MQAIGNKIVQDNPKAKVLYVTSEKFINDLINSIKDADGIKIIKRPLVVDDYKPLKFTFNEDNSINYAGGVVL